MVVRIRLQRFGQKHRAFYRMVVADAKAPRDGRFIERVGTYDPIPARDGCKEITANSERIRYWISVGAQPTYRVEWLLGKVGIIPPPPQRISPNQGIPKAVLKAQKVAAEAAAKAKVKA